MTNEIVQPTVWVDTNVVLEIFSHVDLFQDIAANKDYFRIEERRMRMQDSLWLSMALCRDGTTSLSYEHESDRNMTKLAPTDSPQADWTRAVLYCLSDGGVFDGWTASTTSIGQELGNRARDSLILEQCREHGFILVTRDQELISRAVQMGIPALSPAEFAIDRLSREEARSMFLKRLSVAVNSYPQRFPADVQEFRKQDAIQIWNVYSELIWASPDSLVYLE